MGRKRRRRTPAEMKAGKEAQQKKWDNMSADDMEDLMGQQHGNLALYGYGGQGGRFKNEADAKKFLRAKRASEAQTATQGHIGDMVKQYTGQDLPPPPGQGASPKGQQQGGSPKGQPQQPAMQDNTGAAAGTYMNRMRNQRGAAGRPGFGQFAPTPMQGGAGSPKGQRRPQPRRGGGHPKMGVAMGGGMPPRTGGKTPMPTRAEKMYGSYERMPRRPLPYERAVPRRRGAYNPATGLIE